MNSASAIDLNIRGENVQELYSWYLEGRLVVNRRYQRKLVWTREEKAHLIDTLVRKFPLPLILLAEIQIDGVPKFEIIDGMQRLDSIFSFIENKFAYKDKFFDLETMASSKQLHDDGHLVQRDEVLSRAACAVIANYKIPISTYRIDGSDDIDEIFRRINSNGRVLANQEIRQAGVTGTFADMVREVATEIRGDVSHEDVLLLNKMEEISITNKDLNYGIRVEDIFWVKQSILRKEDIRDSRDEEVIADIIAYVSSAEGERPASSRPLLDEFYGRARDSSVQSRERAVAKKAELDSLASKAGPSVVKTTILSTYNLFNEVFDDHVSFRQCLGDVSPNHGAPRYFQVVFLAFYELLFIEKLKLANLVGLRKALESIDKNVDISTGGNWSAANRVKNVAAVKGVVRSCFVTNPNDPVTLIGRTEFVNLTTRAKTEASSYDFKIGLHRLDATNNFDDSAFEKVLETICAMANLGKGRVGYVVIGVADKQADAKRSFEIYGGNKAAKVGDFFVTGVDAEAAKHHVNLDKYLQLIANKIKASALSEAAKIAVATGIYSVDYDSRSVVVLRVQAGSEPCFLGQKMFRRSGAQTLEVLPTEILQVARLFMS